MKTLHFKTFAQIASLLFMTSYSQLASASTSAEQGLVDNFDNKELTSMGMPRMLITDSSAGGQTNSIVSYKAGKLHHKGEIVPARGQPGWASIVFPLAALGQNFDATSHAGLKLLVKLTKGSLSVSANSNEVTNFDYHASPIIVRADGKFHEVKIPFSQLKRAWSAQTPLNTKSLGSISIVAFSMAKAPFEFSIDQVSFY